jgi:tRNA threonylcarbamoyladenosine biosynthesis protein TsaB
MVNILAIDTSTSLASIAVAVGNTIAAESTFNTDRTLSARLVPEIERLLALAGLAVADIDLFAASTGPGSFTGVRGGIATVQGLAMACGKPCVGFSSLTLLALNFPLTSLPVCTLMDARKSEVYAALFDCSTSLPSAQISDSVMSLGRMLDKLRARAATPVIFSGDGAARYQSLIADHMDGQAIFAPFPLNVAHASNAIPLALHALENGKTLDPSRLLPIYLRASEAEINRGLAVKSGYTAI